MATAGCSTTDGRVLNDESLLPLVEHGRGARARGRRRRRAVGHDGRSRRARSATALDDSGYEDTVLLSYAVKFASAYYGPFREAADSTPAQGDRRSYQMDYRNGREAVREALVDVDEGADWLMVKPALPYLDVIRAVREASLLPLSAYNVSGEYSAVKAAAANGWLDEATIVRENLHRDRARRRRPDHHVSRARRAQGGLVVKSGSHGAQLGSGKRPHSDAWFDAREEGHAGRRELARARVRQRGRHAARDPLGRGRHDHRRRTAASTSTSSARGAR